jgi:hypothetical protein
MARRLGVRVLCKPDSKDSIFQGFDLKDSSAFVFSRIRTSKGLDSKDSIFREGGLDLNGSVQSPLVTARAAAAASGRSAPSRRCLVRNRRDARSIGSSLALLVAEQRCHDADRDTCRTPATIRVARYHADRDQQHHHEHRRVVDSDARRQSVVSAEIGGDSN